MEANPDIEFDHLLAMDLGGMTVEEMRERMSQREWASWQVYYARKHQREELEMARHKGGGR